VIRLGSIFEWGVGRLHLAERTRDHKKAMWTLGHEPEAMDERYTVDGAGTHQVREAFSFHYAVYSSPSME
jgi:hypothetical protein